ncbi:Ubiquitin carboxyl-terminal hydrolase 13 [Sesamum alatum]|uniref:Ubiquitin carboxyl-terminal hydrolase 13 n=1 Tax=Sesamum alatum TaxID=300844 RepID=A0AAE1YQU2_9LAMI|nr:Ubiquitin carboxyl-terminal hydrolase 13 [Sesamum alatum]
MIQSFLQKDDTDNAIRLLKDMRNRNLMPNEAVTSMILHLVIKDENFKAALESLPTIPLGVVTAIAAPDSTIVNFEWQWSSCWSCSDVEMSRNNAGLAAAELALDAEKHILVSGSINTVGQSPRVDEFCLQLSKLDSYDEVVERVANQLGVDDPSKLRLTSHNLYTQQPKAHPIRYRGVDNLLEMLLHYDPPSDILYFKVLDIPLPELQELRSSN